MSSVQRAIDSGAVVTEQMDRTGAPSGAHYVIPGRDMPQLCLIVELHHPYQLRRLRHFDRGRGSATDGFDLAATRQQLEQLVRGRLAPLIRLFGSLEKRPGRFRVALAVSGVLMEQLALWAPGVLDGIRDLVADGVVELLGTTYHHSLAAFTDHDEFAEQVELHRRALRHWFDTSPRVFVNTDAAYWDGLAPILSGLGFAAAIVPDLPDPSERRSPNQVYRATIVPAFRLLPRNERLPGLLDLAPTDGPFTRKDVGGAALGSAIVNVPGTNIQFVLDSRSVADAAAGGEQSALAALMASCDDHGVPLVLPRDAIEAAPRGTLWYSRPAAAVADAPLHRRLYAAGARVMASGNDASIGQWRRLTTSDLWDEPPSEALERLHSLVADIEHPAVSAGTREETGIPWPRPTVEHRWRGQPADVGAIRASA